MVPPCLCNLRNQGWRSGRTYSLHVIGIINHKSEVPNLAQNKELMLSKLRTELCISDERHEELRQRLDSGEERPWVK